MSIKSTIKILAVGAVLALTSYTAVPTAAADFAEELPFSQSAFDAAQKSDKPILVHVTASWCTTCAAQKPILDRLHAEARFKPFVVFNVDFDGQKALVRRFGVRMQSALIVFKGAKEEGRSSGETDPKAIAALLDRGV